MNSNTANPQWDSKFTESGEKVGRESRSDRTDWEFRCHQETLFAIARRFGPNGLAVYVALRSFSDDTGKPVWPSVATVASRIGRKERTARTMLAKLIAAGIIQQQRRKHDTAIYRFPPMHEWADRPEPAAQPRPAKKEAQDRQKNVTKTGRILPGEPSKRTSIKNQREGGNPPAPQPTEEPVSPIPEPLSSPRDQIHAAQVRLNAASYAGSTPNQVIGAIWRDIVTIVDGNAPVYNDRDRKAREDLWEVVCENFTDDLASAQPLLIRIIRTAFWAYEAAKEGKNEYKVWPFHKLDQGKRIAERPKMTVVARQALDLANYEEPVSQTVVKSLDAQEYLHKRDEDRRKAEELAQAREAEAEAARQRSRESKRALIDRYLADPEVDQDKKADAVQRAEEAYTKQYGMHTKAGRTPEKADEYAAPARDHVLHKAAEAAYKLAPCGKLPSQLEKEERASWLSTKVDRSKMASVMMKDEDGNLVPAFEGGGV